MLLSIQSFEISMNRARKMRSVTKFNAFKSISLATSMLLVFTNICIDVNKIMLLTRLQNDYNAPVASEFAVDVSGVTGSRKLSYWLSVGMATLSVLIDVKEVIGSLHKGDYGKLFKVWHILKENNGFYVLNWKNKFRTILCVLLAISLIIPVLVLFICAKLFLLLPLQIVLRILPQAWFRLRELCRPHKASTVSSWISKLPSQLKF
jgi:hypothetical protein